jgi:hypothetical protein
MRIYLSIILLVFFYQLGFNQECEKCDINSLLELHENKDSLDYETVFNFVCTFDTICKNNIEFSQWSNELLFELIETDVNLLNKVLHDLGYDYVKLISKELENPIVDVDILKLYQIVKNSSGPKDMIEEEKRALKKVAKNEGLEIND